MTTVNFSVAAYPLDADGVWCEIRDDAARNGAALFLDRDGVVIEETGYLCRSEGMVLVPGAAKTIVTANRWRIPVVLVSNQGGIGRGLYGWKEFVAVQAAMLSALKTGGAHVDAVYACPHHPLGQGRYAHPDHPARKPNPGMILRAARDLGLDLRRSWMVGDKGLDVEAARRAGLAGALLVLTGYGANEQARSMQLATDAFEVCLGQSIADAASLPIFDTR